MSNGTDVTPNRRGLKSREILLDTAERVMAEHGYDGATVALVVEESQIPLSSVYHYYGSKEGLLLAVMERGTQRFYENLPEPYLACDDVGIRLSETIRTTAAQVESHPDFLTLLMIFSLQSKETQTAEMQALVKHVRELGLVSLGHALAAIFGDDPDDPISAQLGRFALNFFDGAFVMSRADPTVSITTMLEPLGPALIGARDALRSRSDSPSS